MPAQSLPPSPLGRPMFDPVALAHAVVAGDRVSLARAITLVESGAPAHRSLAAALLEQVMPKVGGAVRVGITGVPGVGKSTFIDAFGRLALERGRRLAVLAVDPSSPTSGGSILGDKTRMPRLSTDQRAFVRPTPAGGTLGGVARRTREAMLLCEAAGFDLIFVETVGVGQSETVVADMTDVFLGLMLPGAGDELQGIKRGLLERVDLVAVNKADGAAVQAAERAAQQLRTALGLTRPVSEGNCPQVLLCSALEERGLADIFDAMDVFIAAAREAGRFTARRERQALKWMWGLVEDGLREAFRQHTAVALMLHNTEQDVLRGAIAPTVAAERLLRAFASR